ncbi:MAG: hypothetical protein WCD21_23735 [Streptomyces sp.]
MTSINEKSGLVPGPTCWNRHSPCDAHPCAPPYVARTNRANPPRSMPVIPPSIAIWNRISFPACPITAGSPGSTAYDRVPATGYEIASGGRCETTDRAGDSTGRAGWSD